MTESTAEKPARFALDESKAREWLAQRGEIDGDWSPVHDDDGFTIGCLVSDAQDEGGPITWPDRYGINYERTEDSDGGGYRWFAYGPGSLLLVSPFTAAPAYAGGLPLTPDGRSTTVTGSEAALAVLREAVTEANALLGALAGYVAAQPRAGGEPVWVLRWSDRHNDEVSAHATENAAFAALASMIFHYDDAPPMDDRAAAAWWRERPDCFYDITECPVES